MKKSFLRTAAGLLAALTLAAPGAAFAAAPSVMLDGNALSFSDTAAPLIRSGRTYVPFRVIFEAMGASVSFDSATNTVSAARGETGVSFVIGQKTVKVTDGGETRTVTTDAASFVEKGSTYVPVRFAAQAFSANVGWDNKSETVLLVDCAKRAEGYTDAYSLMNRYLAFTYPSAARALSGRLDLTYTAHTSAGDIAVPLIAAFTATEDSGGISGLVSFSADISQMTAVLGKHPDALPESVDNLLTTLSNTTLGFVISREDGAFYLKGAALDELGVPGGAWVRLPLDSALSTLTLGALSEASYSGLMRHDYRQVITGAGAAVKLTSAQADNTALVQTAMDAAALPFVDAAFQGTDGELTATNTSALAGGAVASESLTLTLSGDTVTRAARTKRVESAGQTVLQSSSTQEADGSVAATLEIRGASYDATASFRMTAEGSAAAPQRRPAEKIVP